MYLATYARYWRLNLLTMLEYRANFFMWAGFNIIYYGTAIMALWVTLRNFPSINGWNFRETAFMYALWMLGHTIHNTFFSLQWVPEWVREGRFDRFLVRPLNPLFQALSVPQNVSPDELMLAALMLVAATAYAHVRVDLLFVLYVPLVAIGGALIDFGVSLAILSLTFVFVRIDTLAWMRYSLESDFSRYPISIYQTGIKIVLAFIVPFAFMNYFPATYLLGKTEAGLNLSPAVGLLTPVVGLLCSTAGYACWRMGINRYQGTGS